MAVTKTIPAFDINRCAAGPVSGHASTRLFAVLHAILPASTPTVTDSTNDTFDSRSNGVCGER